MPTGEITKRFYPTLASVVNEDEIPDVLGFLKEGIVYLFDRIHFKDLQYSKSPRGDAAFYSLSIVSKNRLDIEVPGTGVFLVLNPDLDSGDFEISSFPITIEYEWKLLAYLRSFDLDQFDFSPKAFFETALRVLSISEEQAIANFINTFTVPADDTVSALQQFVTDLNDANLIPPTQETTLTDVVKDIYAKTGDYATIMAFGAYILQNDLEETKGKLKTYFRSLLPQDIEEYIKDILIPKFKATLLLRAAVEFPRSILQPVYNEEGVNPYDASDIGEALEIIQPTDGDNNPKVLISFGEALFYADTEKGFGYNMDIILKTVTPAMIGNTGLILDIHNLKIDLSTEENIIEADLDGRPPEFMGIYTERTDIYLPKKWFKKDTGQTLAITGEQLIIGTGGISGTIALRATYAVNEDNVVESYFEDYFAFTYPITVVSNNTEETIVDATALLTHINALDTPYQLRFKFPLELTVNLSGDTLTFEKEVDYNNFISAIDPNQFMWFNLGGDEDKAWRIGFNRFDISFHHGEVLESHLHAQLELPKFTQEGTTEKALIDLYGEWESNENFRLSATFLPNGLPLNLFDLLTVTFQTAELGKENDVFYVEADTKFSFPEGSLAYTIFRGQEVDLPAIRFYFDGRFEMRGQGIIPTNLTLPIGPVEMSVTAIHLGSIQREYQGKMRKYNYIGFDGGISVDPLGIDVRGNGVKYYYTVDNDEKDENGVSLFSGGDSYFHISTLEVDLVIPGSSDPADAIAIIKGSLTIPEPGVSTEYRGKISLQLPQANIYGEANMALDPKYPAYLIDASVEFPVPIPLGPLGVFGFRGLLGYRYVAEKEAIGMTEDDYWYDYYMAPQRGINIDKFSGPEQTKDYDNALSVGLGASIATMDGGGRTASLRAMMLLSLPSMFAIDAGMTILSERLGMAEDDPTNPPFYAFVIIGDDSLEFGAGADFQLNKGNGWFMDIHAEIQAGFFFKNQHPWYINFGTRQNPITATLFKDAISLRAESFLMIAAAGIEAGARVDFELDLIIAKLYASLEVGGYISFERPQVGGYIIAKGGIDIDFWIFALSASVHVVFRVELIKPFLILAELSFRLCARIGPKWLGIKICIPLKFVLKWEKGNTVDRAPIAPLNYIEDNDPDYPKAIKTNDYVKGVHMLTHEVFNLDFLAVKIGENNTWEPSRTNISAIIPLDTYVDFKLEKGVIPSAISQKIGGHTGAASNYTDLIPPQKNQPGGHVLRQVKHKYSIEDIEIKAWRWNNEAQTQGEWIDYHPFRAILHDDPDPTIDNLKIGYWQRNSGQYDTVRLLATNPFSFLEGGEPGWFIPEQYGITPSELFCTVTTENLECADFLNKTIGTRYYPPMFFEAHYINGAYFTIEGEVYLNEEGEEVGDHGLITNNTNPHGKAKSFTFDNINPLVIILPEASAKVNLKLTTYSETVTIEYYRALNSDTIYQQYELITSVSKTAAELNTVITYDNTSNYNNLGNVAKIRIVPNSPNIALITAIRLQMEELLMDAYEAANGGVSGGVLSGDDLELYNQLNAQLNALKAEACSSDEGDCDKDVRICKLLEDYLTPYFSQYFPSEIQSPNAIEIYLSKYNAFIVHIYDSVGEAYVNENLQPELNEYRTYLEIITENLSEPDTINTYYLLHLKAYTLIKKLTILGNCNCLQNNNPKENCDDKDIVVCNLYDNINQKYLSCLQPKTQLTNISNIDTCVRNIDALIKAFASQHPQYNILDYLSPYHEGLLEETHQLSLYFNGNPSDVSNDDEALALYNSAIVGYTAAIVNLLDDLGNCHCQNTQAEPVRICTTSIQEVCWLTLEQYEYNETIPSQEAVEEDMQEMIAGLQKTVQPVWRPNTEYYIRFRLKDEVDNNESTPGFFDYYYGFKTAGPVGHYHKHPDVNYLPDDIPVNNTNEYPITALNEYIDYKRSYPNANGDLLQSKPLFYGHNQCKISIYFAKQFAYHMLNTWGDYNGLGELKGAMHIAIKDPITNVIIPYPLPTNWEQNETVPETIGNGENGVDWVNDEDPNMPLNIQILNNFINHVNANPNGIHCDIDLGDPIQPVAYAYSVTLTNLKPNKLYTALVFNAFDDNGDGQFTNQVDAQGNIIYEESQKVHEFVFQTSRYNNFREQVQSYWLKELDKEGNTINQQQAVFKNQLILSGQQINNAYALVSGTSNTQIETIAQQFHHDFDRAMEGILAIKPIDPPTTTDFIKIINVNTGDTIGLLVRNPEPFNHPRIPIENIIGTIKVMSNETTEASGYKVLHSKDYSQALIMHSSKKITDNHINLQFQYKTWNGTQYIVEPETGVVTSEKLHTVYVENINLEN